MSDLIQRKERRLNHLLQSINSKISGAWEDVQAIRNEKLYLLHEKTWEEFCVRHWGQSKRHVNRQIRHIAVIQALETDPETGPIGPAVSESATREVADLPVDEAAEVITQAVETAPTDGKGKPKVTAAHVRETRQKTGNAEAGNGRPAKADQKPKPAKGREIVSSAKLVDSLISSHLSPCARALDAIAEANGGKGGRYRAADKSLNTLLSTLARMREGEQ